MELLTDIFSNLKLNKKENSFVLPEEDPNFEGITDDEFSQMYIKSRSQVEEFFKDVNLDKFESKESKESKSPSGKFVLHIISQSTKEDCWNYTLGLIKSIEGEVISKIYRNYSDFRHSWDTKDEDEYLITAEDYQGLTVVNCTKGWIKSWLPKSAKKGCGFCFGSAEISPNGKHILINGCYWGCPYESRIYDFSNPEILPYKRLKRIDDIESFQSYGKWIDDSYHLFINLKELNNKDDAEHIHFKESIKDNNDPFDIKIKKIKEVWENLSSEEHLVYEQKAIQENNERYHDAIEYLCEYIQESSEIDDFKFHSVTCKLDLIYNL